MISTRMEQLQLAAAEYGGHWRGAPPIEVVAKPVDLPVSAPDDARGLLHGGRAYLVAENQHPLLACRTLHHEVVGHHGLRHLLSGDWRHFMSGVQAGIRSGDARLADLAEAVREVYVDDHGEQYLSARGEADEVAAAAVERCVDPVTGRFKAQRPVRAWFAALRGNAARTWLHLDHPVDHEQLVGTLMAADRRLRYGGRMWGVVSRARGWYSAAMTKPWHAKPLQSHDELKTLIEADKSRRRSVDEWKGLGNALLLFVCVAGLVGVVGYLAYRSLAAVFG